eukprot:2394711-Rhodomonas_salina.1
METHLASGRVQAAACQVCAVLSRNHSIGAVRVSAASVIKRVVAAMRANAQTLVVQEQGCRALGNLACNADNKVKIADAGGVEA